MNKTTKKKFNIKRKESFNRKLALQVVFSIMLVAAVIVTKKIDNDAARQFADVTEEKFSQDIDTSSVSKALNNAYDGIKSKIAGITGKLSLAKGKEYAAPVSGEIYLRYGIVKEGDTSYYNHGVDILSDTETVKSIGSGKVVQTGNNEKLSNYVVVQDGSKRMIYGRMGDIFVEEGEQLAKGDIIGALGDNDKILHVEIWENGESLNPVRLFEING